MASISIIIPNLNGAIFLPGCLESLIRAIKNYPETSFEVILVDNASIDNNVAI